MPAAAIPALPPLRGRVQRAVPLAPLTWFRVGGPADVLVRPADPEDLLLLLRDLPRDWPLTVLGAASNLIIRDGGLRGVALRLARGFGEVSVEADGLVAGGAALDATVAECAAAAGLDGLAFLSGIPGSIGGAVAMNAGAYGSEIAEVLDWAEIATPAGLERLSAPELRFAYREARLPERGVVVRARLRARSGMRARTGGSTFRNPPGAKAWQLIDAAGCRGLALGAARVSEKHCNFLINEGGATAAELEALGEAVRARVLAHSGIDLVWEIHRIGEAAP